MPLSLTEMEAIAVKLADEVPDLSGRLAAIEEVAPELGQDLANLDGRVNTLELHSHDSFAPQNTYVITPEGTKEEGKEGKEGPPGPEGPEGPAGPGKEIGKWQHEPGLVEATQKGIGTKEGKGIISATNDAFVVLAIYLLGAILGDSSVTAEVESEEVCFREINSSSPEFTTLVIPVRKNEQLRLVAACKEAGNEASIQVVNVALLE
jgi:hypothetical protein